MKTPKSNRKLSKQSKVNLKPIFLMGIMFAIGIIVLVSVMPVAPVRADAVLMPDCPKSNGTFPFAKQSLDYIVSTPSASTTMSWDLTTPNKASSGGIPGVIEFCVYPNNIGQATGESTSAVGANSASWSAAVDCSSTCAASIRPDGDPSNIPDNGGTVSNVLSVTFSSAPTSWVVVLHINDPGTSGECNALGEGTSTCFVLPTTTTPPPVTAAISTSVSPSVITLGGSTSDTATVSLSPSSATVQGTVNFAAFASLSDCQSNTNPVFSDSESIGPATGSASVASASFTPTDSGTSPTYFVATYMPSSSSNGNTVSTSCGDTGETLDPVGPAPPSATKTATPSFTKTFTWSIKKSVDKTEVDITVGGSAMFTYTVTVTHDSGTYGNWKVTGTITVSNLNPESVTLDSITDAVDNGGTCAVTGSFPAVIPTGNTHFPYTCTYSSAPSPSSGTNTATVDWSTQTLSNGASLTGANAKATATFDFGSVSPTVVDVSVSVTDTLGGTLGTASATGTPCTASAGVTCTDSSTGTTFTYSHTFTGDPAGTCTTHDNTAKFTTSDTGTTGTASQEVKVCVSLASPSISTQLSSTTIGIGGSVSDTATITGGYGTLGGTVTFYYCSGSSCTVASGTEVGSPVSVTSTGSGSGTAQSSSQTFSTAGSYSWIAVYSGDTNNNGVTSGSTVEPLTVGLASPSISTQLPWKSALVGQSAYDTATLSGATSNAGGTVTYYYYSNIGCSAPGTLVSTVTVAKGIVPNSATVPFNTAGKYSWNAVYSGDANNNGATSACEPFYVYAYVTLTVSYSVVGGGSPKAPVFNYVLNKVSKSLTLTTTPQAVTVDALSTWSLTPNPLSGSTSSERWYSSRFLTGTASSTTMLPLVFTFQHQYYLTMKTSGPGTGTPSSGWYNAGAKVTITATANSGHKFKSWTGSGTGSYTGTTNPESITMNSAITETANFT